MSNIAVSIQQPNIAVSLATGATGPAGPAGAPGGSSVTWTAGENLSAARVVVIDSAGEAYHFQPNTTTHQDRAYGITTAAATIGNSATIQISGEMTHASFTFTAGAALYVFTNGILVDSVPATTIIQGAGASSGATTLRIDFSKSILTS